MNRSEVLANRLKWAQDLQRPKNKKYIGKLEFVGDSNSRCCLGHGCHYLDIERKVKNRYVTYDGMGSHAPKSFIDLVGLTDSAGTFIKKSKTDINYQSLAELNDETDITPQRIGHLMETEWLQGGSGTPFKPLTDYAE